MQEKRKSRRIELDSTLIMTRLDDNSKQQISIVVDDVSKTGVGFHCDTPLMIGTVYESFLTIWTKEVLHAFLEIVRIEKRDGDFNYGAIFIGMPEMEASRIEVYDTVTQLIKEQENQ